MTDFSPPRLVTYDVSGTTLADVGGAISHLPEAGKASWAVSYAQSADGAGVVVDATVRCGFQIEMPRWPQYPSASAAARAEWDRWWVALQAHEQGHVDVAMRVFDGLERDMVGRSEAEADAVFRAAEARAQAESDAYDASTNHGLNHGTVMDTSIV